MPNKGQCLSVTQGDSMVRYAAGRYPCSGHMQETRPESFLAALRPSGATTEERPSRA